MQNSFHHSYSIETEINSETSTNSTEAYNTKDNFPYENDSSHIPNKVPIYLTKKKGRLKGSLKAQGANSRRKDNIRKKLIVDILNKLVQFLNVFTIDSYNRHQKHILNRFAKISAKLKAKYSLEKNVENSKS